MKKLLFISLSCLHIVSFAQNYCDYPQLFIDSIGVSATFIAEELVLCNDCENAWGEPTEYKAMIWRPSDEYNEVVPKRPLIIFQHGYHLVNWHVAAWQWSLLMRSEFTTHGFVTASIQYRQNILGLGPFTIFDICSIDETEVIKTQYRAIQDARNAIKVLFEHADEYNIDTNYIFLMGNSQGGNAMSHAVYVEDAEEFLSTGFPDHMYLLDSLGPWEPRKKIAGLLTQSSALFSTEFIDLTDSLPTFLAHGTCDTVVPYKAGTIYNCPSEYDLFGSYAIACKRQQLGLSYSLHTYKGMGHAWTEDAVTGSYPIIRSWLKTMICNYNNDDEHIIYNIDPLACTDITTSLSGDCDRNCYSLQAPEGLLANPAPDGNHVGLSWGQLPEVNLYQVKGRKTGTLPFGSFISSNTWKNIGGLSSNTSYEWKLRARCDDMETITEFSPLDTFSTANPLMKLADNSENKLLIYPNPANEHFYIEDISMHSSSYKLRILSVTGSPILEKDIILNKNGKVKVSLSGISPGIYFVNLTNSEEEKIATLIVSR